jgi:hypothetical protein
MGNLNDTDKKPNAYLFVTVFKINISFNSIRVLKEATLLYQWLEKCWKDGVIWENLYLWFPKISKSAFYIKWKLKSKLIIL